MPQVVIEHPVINSPFDEPSRHFKFDETGITIRDRLRVQLPSDPESYYRTMDNHVVEDTK